jgi:hypothetical protein
VHTHSVTEARKLLGLEAAKLQFLEKVRWLLFCTDAKVVNCVKHLTNSSRHEPFSVAAFRDPAKGGHCELTWAAQRFQLL